jgi:hypothetical protein
MASPVTGSAYLIKSDHCLSLFKTAHEAGKIRELQVVTIVIGEDITIDL